jgi:trigger factor
MAYQIEHPSASRVVLTATVPADEVAKEREHVVKEFLHGARIDGFRKGKAPRPLVERRFADDIGHELEEHIARHVWREVQEKEQMRLASPLGIKQAKVEPDGSFVLEGEFEVYPTVELPELGGFTPPSYDLTPTEQEREQALEQLRERQATWEPAEDQAADAGMLVEAGVHGSYPDDDGEPFEDERSLFQIGANEVYPEIDTAIRGHRVGDEVATERTIGPEGGAEREGKRIAYRIILKSLRRKRLPDVDDTFATSLGLEGGVAALQEKVVEGITHQKREHRRELWRDALVGYLANHKSLELPESVVTEDTRKEMVDFARTLALRGIDPEKQQVDWGKLEPEMRQRVEKRLRAELLLDALADSLGISVAAGEIDQEVERQARRLKIPCAELRGNLGKSGGLDRVGAIIRREKAADQVLGPFVKES